MKRFLLLLCFAASLSAAIPATAVWEVRGGSGADTNGGGFVPGTGTTTIAAQADLAYSSGTATSAGHSFVTADQYKWLTITASPIWGLVIVGNGTSGCTSPTVAISAGGGSGATATLTVAGGIVTSSAMTAIGTGYTGAPTLTFTSTGCSTPVTGYAYLAYQLGWYQILSTASNAATLDHSPLNPLTGATTATVGTYTLYNGVDMSQFNNKNATSCTSCYSATANISTTDVVTNNTTTVTSATGAFTAALQGNLVQLSGAGTTTGWYEVTAVASATSITVDRATGGAGGTAQTMNIGGALNTIGGLASAMVASNKAFIKASATYATSTSNVFAQSAVPSNTISATSLWGYSSTRGDNGRPTLQASAGTTGALLSLPNNGFDIRNLILDGNSQANSSGIVSTGNLTSIANVKVIGTTANALNVTDQIFITSCEVTGASGNVIVLNGTNQVVVMQNCYIHDNPTGGAVVTLGGGGGVVQNNLLTNNGNSSSIGIWITSGISYTITGNTIYGQGSDALQIYGGSVSPDTIRNNIFANNGGCGLNVFGAARVALDGNGYWANAKGNRCNNDDQITIVTNGVTPYVDTHDVFFTASPFTNPGVADWTLNNTAGGGALARAAGLPGILPGLAVAGYLDLGALQHQSSAASGGASAYVF